MSTMDISKDLELIDMEGEMEASEAMIMEEGEIVEANLVDQASAVAESNGFECPHCHYVWGVIRTISGIILSARLDWEEQPTIQPANWSLKS